MTVYPNDVMRATAKQFGPNEQQIANVFFWQFRGTATVPDATAMVAMTNAIDNMFQAIEAYIPNDQQADEVEFYNVTQDTPMGSYGWPVYTGGTGLGEYLPTGNAALMTATTAVKKVLPKKFLGTLVEEAVQNGEWVSAFMTALGIAAGHWFTSIPLGAQGTLYSGTIKRLTGVFIDLVSVIVKSVGSYQRRRKPGVGI